DSSQRARENVVGSTWRRIAAVAVRFVAECSVSRMRRGSDGDRWFIWKAPSVRASGLFYIRPVTYRLDRAGSSACWYASGLASRQYMLGSTNSVNNVPTDMPVAITRP